MIEDYQHRLEILFDSQSQKFPDHSPEGGEARSEIDKIRGSIHDTCILLSIIIPAYNEGNDNSLGPEHVRYHQDNPRESRIQQLLALLLTLQLPPNTEIIVVNNNSRDNTVECVMNFYKSHADVFSKRDVRLRLANAIDQGPAPARNVGIYLAKGKFCLFLDADTEGFIAKNGNSVQEMIPGLLAEIQNKGADCSTMPTRLGSKTEENPLLGAAFNFAKGLLASTNYPIVNGTGILCTRGIAIRVGGFDTKTTIGEDFLFGQQVRAQNGKIIVSGVATLVTDRRRKNKTHYDGAKLAEKYFLASRSTEDADPEVPERLAKIREMGAQFYFSFFQFTFLLHALAYISGSKSFNITVGFEDMAKRSAGVTHNTFDSFMATMLPVVPQKAIKAMAKGEELLSKMKRIFK